MNGLLGLVAALVISLVPSLMFLGLWYGLMYLRDDDLIERAREMEAQRPQYSPGARPAGGSPVRTDRRTDPRGAVSCERCGTRNATGVTYCWQCLAELPE
jgi:hypothetical protein